MDNQEKGVKGKNKRKTIIKAQERLNEEKRLRKRTTERMESKLKMEMKEDHDKMSRNNTGKIAQETMKVKVKNER